VNLGLTRERKSGNILIESISKGGLSDIGDSLYNVFEPVVMNEYPIVRELKTNLTQSGILGVLMTGSGPTVFALTQDISTAERIQKQVQHSSYCVVTETSNFSIART
jgi:4-diphosphocytidyl-2-C-methyl-D-erythritol kinase